MSNNDKASEYGKKNVDSKRGEGGGGSGQS